MTVVWIKYDLDNPDDLQDMTLMHKAKDLYSALWDIQQVILRPKYKYREIDTIEAQELITEIYTEVGERIGSLLDE